jgi:hypothetical protein
VGGGGPRHRGGLGGAARRCECGECGLPNGRAVRRFVVIGLDVIAFDGVDSTGSDSKGSDAPKPRPTTTSDVGKPDPADAKSGKPGADQTTATEAEASGPEKSEPTAAESVDAGDHTTKRTTQAAGTARKKQPATETVASESAPPQVARAVDEPDPTPAKTLSEAAAPAAAVAAVPSAPTVFGVIQGIVGAVVVNVGSLAFNTVQAVEALVTGPPVLPPGSTVTVRSSTILLSTGQRVAANWYYPEGADVPAHMILLQHGFLALGPMYSYTAANLAEKTQSIVVTPTLSSNPFAGDANWLGGSGMSAAIGDLFEGNREALTQSAIDAGFATRYVVDAALPQKFALSGHSLGANLVSGAAGHLADECTVDSCAAADLIGVILLDGVPFADTLPHALTALNDKQALTGLIPVREIGAPPNLYNSTSNVNDALSAGRPDRYKGVLLGGGVRSDSMQGGNPLIQFALYVAAGFPEPQNPPAVDELSVQWFNEWFAGDTSSGDDPVSGTTIDIPPQGAPRMAS